MSVIEEIEFKALTMSLDIEGLEHGGLQFQDYAGLVSKRAFTGVGVNTEFEQDNRLAVQGDSEPRAIGNVAGLLNENVEVGFMVKLEHGRIVWMEGYTYGDARWPEVITSYSLFKDDVAII